MSTYKSVHTCLGSREHLHLSQKSNYQLRVFFDDLFFVILNVGINIKKIFFGQRLLRYDFKPLLF